MSAEQDIRELLGTYEHALNASDAVLAAGCYTRDGVFMPTTLPTAVGPELLGAYRRTFEAIRLDVVFTVDELVVLTDAAAHAMTRSNAAQPGRAVLSRSGHDQDARSAVEDVVGDADAGVGGARDEHAVPRPTVSTAAAR